MLGLCLTVLVGLKQSNLALLGIFLGAVVTALAVEWRISPRAWLSALFALPLPLITLFLWQRYTRAEMPSGAMSVLPFAQWHFDEAGAMLASVLRLMLRKSGHFGVMFALTAAAIMSFRPSSRADAEAKFFSRAVALMFLGYTGFLISAYIAISFLPGEVRQAASFWRYSTQLGLAGLLAATVLLTPMWRPGPQWGARLTVVLAAILLLMPAATGHRLRYDLDKTHQGFSAAVARDLARVLPDHAHLAIVELHGSGNSAVMHYELQFRQKVNIAWPPFSIDRLDREHARPYLATLNSTRAATATYVWVDDGGPDTRGIFGIDLPQGAAYLLERREGTYTLIKSWAFSPEKEHFVPADFR